MDGGDATIDGEDLPGDVLPGAAREQQGGALEVLIIADALEVDMENYLEAAKEARGNNQREDVKTFTEAAERIGTLLAKVRDLLE